MEQHVVLKNPNQGGKDPAIKGERGALFKGVLQLVLLAGREAEQRWFGGRRDLDYSAPRVWWLCTLLCRKAEAQGKTEQA